MNLRDIEKLHSDYLRRVQAYLGRAYKADASTRPLGVFHLLQQAKRSNPSFLGEFGTGFSTLVLRLSAPHIQIESLDHDPNWLEFMRRMLKDYRLSTDRMREIEDLRAESRMLAQPIYDMVFVDHGPTMEARWNDLPWVMSLLKPQGTAILDDWWPVGVRPYNGTKRGIRIMSRLGFRLDPLEVSRPVPAEKAICIAQR